MSDHALPVLIVGGGIGGLAVATGLAHHDIASCVLERRTDFGDEGAGIQLGPNAMHILAKWGLDARIGEFACQPQNLHLFDGATGSLLNCAPLGSTALARYGAPYLTIKRADLHNVLYGAARDHPLIAVRAGAECASISEQDFRITAHLNDGETVQGRILIGADGIHSQLRNTFAAVMLPKTGWYAWRTTRRRDDVSAFLRQDRVGLWMHPLGHLVHYPVAGGAEVNIVAVTRDGQDQSAPSFADWCPQISNVAALDGWACWALYDMPPLDIWHRGRLVLLGDAAHPLLPFLASGGVMAIEDADALARSIAATPEAATTAFTTYTSERQARINRVAAASRRMGEIYHMHGYRRLARNAVLRRYPSSLLLARSDWLYGYRPDHAAHQKSEAGD